MLDGFSKRDFAIFAGVLLLAGALTVGVVDFVIYHYVFQDTNAAPPSRNNPERSGEPRVGFPFARTDDLPKTALALSPSAPGPFSLRRLKEAD